MEAFFAWIPTAFNALVNWVKGSPATQKVNTPQAGTINTLFNTLSGNISSYTEKSLMTALERAFTPPGAETPFERDIEYQGAVTSEISDMKRLADLALKGLPSGAESTASWIQNKFNEQAGILASGARNVADPGMFKGAMERLLIYFTGAASDKVPITNNLEGQKAEVSSWLKGQGVPLDVSASTAPDINTLYDILSQLIGGQPFATVPTAGGSEKILYTAPVTQAASDYTPVILLALGGFALYMVFKKGGKK